MTDMPSDPHPLQPRPSGNGTDPREVALRALADQSRPEAPAGSAWALTDQILVHTSWDAAQKLLVASQERCKWVGAQALHGEVRRRS
jgi:hypothetical protein